MAGSGLHVHVSLLDAHGRNIFAAADPLASAPLRHAIAGTLATLADGMALCAPGPNSFRRFRNEAYVPLHATWSINNRGSAIRVPASDAANLRIEHRLAGADANPYLVVAWVLAGIHPRPHAQARAAAGDYRQCLRAAGRSAADPLERSHRTRSRAANSPRATFGEKFVNLYATVKRDELQEFASHITPLEIARYLGPL